MLPRVVDEKISRAWLQAGRDLDIRVVAPVHLQAAGEEMTFEAHILDFGGPKGTIVGVIGDENPWDGLRRMLGYYASNLSPKYRTYQRELFIDTLNDWKWFRECVVPPKWYSGKSWS